MVIKAFLLVVVATSILLVIYVFHTGYLQDPYGYTISSIPITSKDGNNTAVLEMLDIVRDTPNLWGFRNEDDHEKRRNESSTSRIIQQREFISRIANTKFIQGSKTKKILVYTDRSDNVFHDTENKVQCPYAPTFTSKCELVIIHKKMPEQLKNQYEPFVYKYMMDVDAVATVRNGYWGIDDVVPEPQPAFGIPSIIYTRESPCHTGSARYGELGAWAANYWRGADIPTGNRGIVWINGSENSYEDHYQKLPPHPDARSEKKYLVAALISNCLFIKNNRLGYIRELMKHVDVHVYGKCGDKKCPKSKDGSDDCINHIQKNYKFYLAFENCNCRDYITEKFFSTALRNGVVPVAMGAPRSDYEEVAPPNSFIHVDDFQSPQELASYLLKLDKNVYEYNKYLEWRDQNNWAISHDGGFDMFCRMCGLIYYADFRPPTPWPHRTTRFRDITQCASSGQWNWNPTKV